MTLNARTQQMDHTRLDSLLAQYTIFATADGPVDAGRHRRPGATTEEGVTTEEATYFRAGCRRADEETPELVSNVV